MKQIIFLFTFIISPLLVLAQGEVTVTIKVVDGKGQVITGAEVMLKELSSGKTRTQYTQAGGETTFLLNEGKEWGLFINKYPFKNIIKVPEDGSATQRMTLTYNPAVADRFKQQVTDRSKLAITDEISSVVKDGVPPKGMALVKVQLKSTQGKKQAGKKVKLVCIKMLRSYSAISDVNGIARFFVPISRNYDIDVEERMNASHIDLLAHEGLAVTVEVTYDPTEITENRQGDTIDQVLKQPVKPTSSRAYYIITVIRGGSPVPNEDIWLSDINGKDVYHALTNSKGEAEFLLPLGRKFMIHFPFQKDVDVVDLVDKRGTVNGSMTVTYVPDPKLQNPGLYVPTGEQLFLKDFEGFLKKQFPKPKPGKNIGLFLQWGNPVNEKSKEAVLELGISATNQHPPNGKPVNISFVLDRSGSMAGYERIERLKDAFAAYIDKMKPTDIISIFLYDDKMEVLLPPQRIGSNKQKIKTLIGSIQPGGGTNMLEAMKAGYEAVLRNYVKEGNNRVVLLTDGYDANEVGVLVNAQKPYNVKGIECTTVGVGQGYNYSLLKQLATNGGGMLLFAGEAEQIDKVFNNDLAGLLNPVGEQATIEIEYNSKIVFKELYGYPLKKNADNIATIKMPLLYPGLNRVALVKFELPRPDAGIERSPVTVRIRYFDLIRNAWETVEEKAYLKWQPGSGKWELIAEQEQKKLYCIAVVNQSLKTMAEAYAKGENKKAQEILERAKEQLSELYPKADDTDIQELAESIDEYLEAFKNLANKKGKH